MIHTSRQLKALVRNMSKGNSAKAQIIIRNYVMERFLERLSLSAYRNNIILKPVSVFHKLSLRFDCCSRSTSAASIRLD